MAGPQRVGGGPGRCEAIRVLLAGKRPNRRSGRAKSRDKVNLESPSYQKTAAIAMQTRRKTSVKTTSLRFGLYDVSSMSRLQPGRA